MASTGIDHQYAKVLRTEIEMHFFENRVLRIFEVNCNDAADGDGELIHQAARLVKIVVLGILSDRGEGLWRNAALVVQVVENRCNQNFNGGRGAQSGADRNFAADPGIEAAEF